MTDERPLELSAPVDAADAPVAEVLAVIGQQAIVVLAETRAGAPNDLCGRKDGDGVFDPAYLVAAGESGQGHLLDRAALPAPGEPRVVHHPTLADVNAVMAIAAAQGGQMGPWRGLLLEAQGPQLQWPRGAALGLERADFPTEHDLIFPGSSEVKWAPFGGSAPSWDRPPEWC